MFTPILILLSKVLSLASLFILANDYNVSSNARVSWYEYGSITANGEVYFPGSLTCASYDLPFNTLLYLKAGANKVVCRVNDRGPFATDDKGKAIYPLRRHPTRDLDLSRGTYNALFDGLNSGVNTVIITKVKFP